MPIETDRLVQVIRQEMPTHAEIQVVPGFGAVNIDVSWKLNSDPARPNKMSRTISICASHEGVEDFANASAVDQAAAYERVAKFLRAKVPNFNPEHDVPKDEPPPAEQWVIGSDVLVG